MAAIHSITTSDMKVAVYSMNHKTITYQLLTNTHAVNSAFLKCYWKTPLSLEVVVDTGNLF